jgi:hypothetical protein
MRRVRSAFPDRAAAQPRVAGCGKQAASSGFFGVPGHLAQPNNSCRRIDEQSVLQTWLMATWTMRLLNCHSLRWPFAEKTKSSATPPRTLPCMPSHHYRNILQTHASRNRVRHRPPGMLRHRQSSPMSMRCRPSQCQPRSWSTTILSHWTASLAWRWILRRATVTLRSVTRSTGRHSLSHFADSTQLKMFRSSTTSLRASVYEFIQENGRTYHSYNSGSMFTGLRIALC